MNHKESVVDKMLAYMNEKYDDHFEYSSTFSGGSGASFAQIIVKSEKYPEAEIWVEYEKRDGNEIFADNYVSYKYEKQTRNALENLLKEVFGEKIKLRYGVGTRGRINHFTSDTSFETFIRDPASSVRFRAFVLEQETDPAITENKLKKAIENSEFVISGVLYLTNDETEFERAFELSDEALSRIPKMQIIMDAPCSFLTYEWR